MLPPPRLPTGLQSKSFLPCANVQGIFLRRNLSHQSNNFFLAIQPRTAPQLLDQYGIFELRNRRLFIPLEADFLLNFPLRKRDML